MNENNLPTRCCTRDESYNNCRNRREKKEEASSKKACILCIHTSTTFCCGSVMSTRPVNISIYPKGGEAGNIPAPP